MLASAEDDGNARSIILNVASEAGLANDVDGGCRSLVSGMKSHQRGIYCGGGGARRRAESPISRADVYFAQLRNGLGCLLPWRNALGQELGAPLAW